jgi:23S rRNA (adenine2503-C2)-methyltransferase
MEFYQDILANEKKYRLNQVNHSFYRDLNFNFKDITVLPQELREKLDKSLVFPLETKKILVSKDSQTVKFLFKTQDNHFIETVLLRHLKDRNTLCLSSQIGCPLKCAFCATGKMGFIRNLTVDEMISQFLLVKKYLQKENLILKNVVFMGMGEPLLNYNNLIKTLYLMNNDKLGGIGVRHLTVSTAGVIEGINKLSDFDLSVNLAVSLHSPTQELRQKIMPVTYTNPLTDLMKAIKKYQKKTNKRIFYEYIMLKDVNDQPKNAYLLGELLQGSLAHINFIRYHSSKDDLFVSSDEKRIREFQKILNTFSLPSTLRVSFGEDIKGACGQLANL